MKGQDSDEEGARPKAMCARPYAHLRRVRTCEGGLCEVMLRASRGMGGWGRVGLGVGWGGEGGGWMV